MSAVFNAPPSIPDAINLQLYAQWQDRINQLPQVVNHCVSRDQAESWLKTLVTIEHALRPEKLEKAVDFHISRLRGFGGTDIGILKAHDNDNAFHPFGNVYTLLKQKAMIIQPDQPTNAMHRGIVLEQLVREIFIAKTNAVQDTQKIKQIKVHASQDNLEHPWLIGTPDDHLIIDGIRVTPDYKVPGDGGEIIHHQLLEHYTTQLNHYDLISQNAGVPADELMVVTLNIKPDVADHYIDMITASPNMAKHIHELARDLANIPNSPLQVIPHRIESSQKIKNEILRLGDRAWDWVLKGEKPHFNKKSTPVYNATKQHTISDLSKQYLNLDTTKKAITTKFDEVKKELNKILFEGVAVQKGMPVPHQLLSCNVMEKFDLDSAYKTLLAAGISEKSLLDKPDYDLDLLIQKVEVLGGDPKECMQAGNVNKNLVLTALDAIGYNPEQFYSRTANLKITGSKSSMVQSQINQIQETVDDNLNTMIEKLDKDHTVNHDALLDPDAFVAQARSQSLKH